MRILNKYILYSLIACLFFSCRAKNDEADAPVETRIPVTVTTIVNGPLQERIELNATSTFLQKWVVRANTIGYLQTAKVQLNKYVRDGELLYTIKTKEAASVGNTINILDSTFKFSGINSVTANGNGFISQIDHQSGDYVQDGEQLAVITDTKSFVFLLNLPYELQGYLAGKKYLDMVLPDGEKLIGNMAGIMPSVDSVSQTQHVILKINSAHPLPENLIAKVTLITTNKSNTTYLPKAAVLTDETQTNFWVMKMTDSITAVKVLVKKGIETADKVEIVSPAFLSTDKIILTGNYGLEDTAKVQIEQ
jgi:hypothetical protein